MEKIYGKRYREMEIWICIYIELIKRKGEELVMLFG